LQRILGYRKNFDTTWHLGLLYKLSKLGFSTNLIKLITFAKKISVEGEMSKPMFKQAGVPQGSVISPTLYNMYENDAPQTPGVHLALVASSTCLYARELKEGYVQSKIAAAWCQRWDIKINEDKTQAIYFLIESYIEWTEDSICKQCKVSRCCSR
jgi:hypothetical protein